MKKQRTALLGIRLELIEVSTTRPLDIKSYYDKYLVEIGNCRILSSDAPRMPLMYKRALHRYDPELVAPLLAGKNPYGDRSCGVAKCIRPDHIKDLL